MIELSITVKDESSKLTEKDTLYDGLQLSKDDKSLAGRVQDCAIKFLQTRKNSAEGPEDIDIIVTAKMVWQ
jgi:hypothetical protein